MRASFARRMPDLALHAMPGLAAAAGRFIVFLDADDELLPGAIDAGVAILQQHPSLACVVRRCQVMDAERRTVETVHSQLTTTDLYREWLRQNFVWTPGAAVFRTARIAAIGGFPADVAAAADYAVYLTLARNREVRFDDREFVRYRQHDSNMSLDPVLMLRATLSVLARERRHVPPEYVDAFRDGVREWRQHYGEQIIERLRRERRAGDSTPWQKRAVWTLVTTCPRVMATHASRKIARVLRGLSPAPIEPGRFGPEVPPPPSRRGHAS